MVFNMCYILVKRNILHMYTVQFFDEVWLFDHPYDHVASPLAWREDFRRLIEAEAEATV